MQAFETKQEQLSVNEDHKQFEVLKEKNHTTANKTRRIKRKHIMPI